MLSEAGCLARRKRLWEALGPEIEWVLVADPRHVTYLSGFSVNPLSFSNGERGVLYLSREGEAILVCDNFTLGSAIGPPVVDQTVVEPWYDHRHGVPNRDHVLFRALAHLRGRCAASPGLIEGEWFPVAALAEVGIDPAGGLGREDSVSLGSLIRGLRRRKEADEIALLTRCFRAGEAGHRRARETVKPGLSELDLYREVQSAAIDEIGEPVLVYGDFRATTAQNPRAGGLPTDYVMTKGDIAILDFSVVLSGYRSDFTNSIAVGAPTGRQRELMELCLEALAAGERALRPGVEGRTIHAAVNEPLAAAGIPLPAHAGHGIGLGHPEAPAFVPESDELLAAGEIVTLEPGAYVEGIGGMRIERNYLVTPTGCEALTHHEIGL